MNALIGHTGVIGQSLLDAMHFDLVFNSSNIDQLCEHSIDMLVVAAPTGNRRAVNLGLINDTDAIDCIVNNVIRAQPRLTVVIGSVDAVLAPNSKYGASRLRLEQQLSNRVPCGIIRLPTLCGQQIVKNILYDIKHRQFLDQVDAGAWLQWCVLSDLAQHVDRCDQHQVINLVSEPIQNKDILTRFAPDVVQRFLPVSAYYNQRPWVYSQDEIFAAMELYLS